MSYFRVEQLSSKRLAIAEQSLATTAEAAETFKRSGADPLRYGVDLEKVVQQRDDARRKYEGEQRDRQAELAKIREQAVADARAAWNAGNTYFAPVLFQQLVRDSAGWEVALQQVTEIGWRLDSWQVIGAAPEPFESTVTLIQTLFVR